MPHYQNSIIYKIKHNEDFDDTNIYVGSTSNFKNRKSAHKSACCNEKDKNYNFPIYQYIRSNGGWNAWVIIPIEKYSCNDKDELIIRERYYIDLLRSTLNIVKPGRTNKEWCEDNKEKIAEKQKEYYEANKKKVLEHCKQYRNDNKEKIQEYQKIYRYDNTETSKEYRKKYYEDNKEKITKSLKKYRNDNKEIINEKKKEKVICEHCGSETSKTNLKRHQQSKHCINFVK